MKTNIMHSAVWLGAALVFLSLAAPADVLDHWTTNQASTNYFGLRCVAYGNGRYVAGGGFYDAGVLLSSEDGQQWSVRCMGGSSSGLGFLDSVIYAGGRFVAVGLWGQTAVSTDGINWSIGDVPYGLAPSDGFYGAAYGNGVYVAVGGPACSADLNVFTSPDGQSWTAQHSTSPSGASLGDVAYGEACRFVAIGIGSAAGHAYTSSDGTNWTQHTIAGGTQISYCHGHFLIPLGPGTNLISSDGLTWSAQRTGLTTLLGKATYSHGSYLARAGAALAASADGTNWFQYPQPLPGTSTVASDGQRLVTVGNDDFPFYPLFGNACTYCGVTGIAYTGIGIASV